MSESSKIKNRTIETLEDLLAHAIALENEAVERYDEIADNMDVHNNPQVAGLFRRLAGYGRKHAEEMENRAVHMALPHIAPWDFLWQSADSPEAAEVGETHYLMTPYHVVELAHRVEMTAHTFYQGVAETSTNPAVKILAREFAAEEAEHVALLEEWRERYPHPDINWDEDLDPPMMHE